jgi:hypothetical protein
MAALNIVSALYFPSLYDVKKTVDKCNNIIAKYEDAIPMTEDELPSVIWEGMDCKTFVLGTVLFKTSNFRWDMTAGDTSVEFEKWELDHYEDVYKHQFRKAFPLYRDLVRDYQFKLLSFINFT